MLEDTPTVAREEVNQTSFEHEERIELPCDNK